MSKPVNKRQVRNNLFTRKMPHTLSPLSKKFNNCTINRRIIRCNVIRLPVLWVSLWNLQHSCTFPLVALLRLTAKGSVLHGVIVGLSRLNSQKEAMSGYTPDEKLRVEQLSKLRRQWLKDQELSPREPVVQGKAPGGVTKFWAGFLEPKSLWRLYVSPPQQLTTANS